ncbi:MAG: methionyl-tRNA formyltransferase [Planctomycetes bacterium]|nr:methionyl-tRNA formyltransferase [Planctomycetota bacterium]
MRITVFTGNQARHVALIEALTQIADEVFAVQECTTVFPGQVDDFFRRSEVMQKYFRRVLSAEQLVFGQTRFVSKEARQLAIRMGDLSRLATGVLAPALQSDVYLVFGASYIKGPLCDHLVANRAVNIHMGVSPFYRGSSTNFWAMYDRRPEYVGATIHRLTAGLDSGPIICHAFPRAESADPFIIGMRAVQAAHRAVVEHLRAGDLHDMQPVDQDRSMEIRYSRNSDFTDDVAGEYLERVPTAGEMESAMKGRKFEGAVRPFAA